MDHKPSLTKWYYYLVKVEKVKNGDLAESKKKVYFKFGPIYAVFYPVLPSP